MADTFTCFQDAARALLDTACLTEKEGQFCGGLAFRLHPITDKQADWLRILLVRHRLPPLAEGGESCHDG